MRALLAFYLRVLLRSAPIALGMALAVLLWILLMHAYGSLNTSWAGSVAGVACLDFLFLGVYLSRAGDDLFRWLPVASRRALTARLLVLGSAWLPVAAALATVTTSTCVVARIANLVLLGVAALAIAEGTSRLLRGTGPVRIALVGGAAAGACLGGFIAAVREPALGTMAPTPWIVAVAGLLLLAVFALPTRDEVARREGRGNAAARRGTRTPARSLLRIACLDPMTLAFAALLFLMSIFYPIVDRMNLLYAFLLLSWAPMLFQGALHAYRRVLPLPIPRGRAFRTFVLPVWSGFAFFLAVRAATAVLASGHVGEPVAESLVLMAIAGVVFYVQLVASRNLGIVLGLLLVIVMAPVIILPFLGVAAAQGALDAVKAAWLGALSFGGGIGAALVAVAGAGVAGATLLGMWRVFPRLQWTDLPAASSRIGE